VSLTLLDIDADFMLNKDYNWSHYKENVRSRSKISISGEYLGKVLRPFLKKGVDVIIEVDHQESLYWWDCYDVHDALCIHVDAHHDMWSNGGIGPSIRDRVDCGNYLQQALYDRIVEKVVFIPSPFRSIHHQRADMLDNLKPKILPSRIQVQAWKTFKKCVREYPQADIITISISPEWFPSQHWHHVEDLAKILGMKKDIIQRAKKEAFQKWNAMKTGRWRWGYRDFVFPYRGIRSNTLQKLKENLQMKRAKWIRKG